MLSCVDSFFLRAAAFSRQQAYYSLDRYQLSHSDQVVSRRREDEDPIHALSPAVAQLAQQTYRLQPAEDLFDPFTLPLTDLIALVSCGAAIDGRLAVSVVLGHVRRHLQLAQVLHEVLGVVVLVAARA